MKHTIFITGTDTGVGKTVLTALLAQFLRGRGVESRRSNRFAPADGTMRWQLHAALGGALTLDEINPWHFRAAIAPLLAARREN